MRIANPIGVRGEHAACEFLRKKGYTIIERNYRKQYVEIDVIALHNNTLVFVEVKTRTSDAFGSPFEAIAPWKVKALVKLGQYYKLTHPKLPNSLRFDAIGVMMNGSRIETIEHLENITG